ncbi:hypothetical protein [Tenacibaculum sp. 190524A02b]
MKTKVLVIAFLLANFLVAGQENYFEWNGKTSYFPNEKENQVAYINFGDAQLWGWVEVTISGGYNYRLTTGKYTKRFQIGKNPAGGYFHQKSEVPTNFGHVGGEWKIGEFEYENGNLRIPIYHLLKTANQLSISIVGVSNTPYNVSNISISPIITLANNETRDYVTVTDRVNIGSAINIKPYQSVWLTGKNDYRGINATQHKKGHYQSIIRQKTVNNHVVNIGGINDVFGFFGYDNDRTANGYDYSMVMDLNKGHIGIGQINPDARLTVLSKDHLIARFQNGDASDKTRGIRLNSKNTQGAVKYFDIAIDAEDEKVGLGIGTSSGNLPIGKTDLAHAQLVIDRKDGGSVGIGTTDTKGFKLGVDGRVAATEVKIAKYENWPDYVFKNTYELPTLSEVENHIKTKGHLQNIPSAKEVEKEGFFLGNMDAKLLEKIEELTLYTIQQEKEIKQLKELKEENKNLKERLDKLEKMVNQFLNK